MVGESNHGTARRTCSVRERLEGDAIGFGNKSCRGDFQEAVVATLDP